MKRNYIILIVIVAVVLVAFPTPHTREKQDLVKTLDCSRTLQDGESLQELWVDMQDETRIVIHIESSEPVQVLISTSGYLGTLYPLYIQEKKVHYLSAIFSYNSYEIFIENPTIFATGPDAVMSGSIKAYHIYETQEWLPWWMP